MLLQTITRIIASVSLCAILAAPVQAQTTSKKTTVVITFDQAPTSVTINNAKLKYNKKMAYSFTLDDGYVSAYSNVLPLFKGGKAANGTTYPGCFYTDGCGHSLPFKAGVAWNSMNNEGTMDTHVDNPSYLTWAQLDELYLQGWDVLNHGYSHKTRGWSASGQPNPSLADWEYDQEIIKNNDHVKAMTKNKIVMTHFVVPSGDNGYYPRVAATGMAALYDQNWELPGNGAGLSVGSALNYTNFKLNRSIMSNDPNVANGVVNTTFSTVNQLLGNTYWINSFTHDVDPKATSGGVDLGNLATHMNYVANTYGSKGKDILWMAPLQEVYEYCVLRDKVKMTWRQSGNKVYVDFDLSAVPQNLRRKALTLSIQADQPFSKVEVPNMPQLSFNGKKGTQIINLDFASLFQTQGLIPDEFVTGVTDEQLTTAAEVFPNPVDDVLHIQSQGFGSEALSISIVNNLGLEVLHTTLNAQAQQLILDTHTLPDGNYFVNVKSETMKSKTFRFMKREAN